MSSSSEFVQTDVGTLDIDGLVGISIVPDGAAARVLITFKNQSTQTLYCRDHEDSAKVHSKLSLAVQERCKRLQKNQVNRRIIEKCAASMKYKLVELSHVSDAELLSRIVKGLDLDDEMKLEFQDLTCVWSF